MGDMLVVKFAELQNAAAHIDTALNKIQNDLAELERSAAPLVADWSGEAREAYLVRQQRWQTAATELSAILRDIKGAVQQSAAEYQNAERKNTSRFE